MMFTKFFLNQDIFLGDSLSKPSWKSGTPRSIFANSAPLGRVGLRVAMSVCVSAPSGAVFSWPLIGQWPRPFNHWSSAPQPFNHWSSAAVQTLNWSAAGAAVQPVFCLIVLASVLLSAYNERVGVSRMRDFFFLSFIKHCSRLWIKKSIKLSWYTFRLGLY